MLSEQKKANEKIVFRLFYVVSVLFFFMVFPVQALAGTHRVKVETEPLWLDDFGHFTDVNTYVTKDVDGVQRTYPGYLTDENGDYCNIANYMSADPNFFVKQHNFAGLDPLFGPYDHDNCAADGYKHYACWEDCNGIRVEDGYYAILDNPNTANCGRSDRDYWDGGDHTGNRNGGMLFVNCSNDSKGAIVYERELLLCDTCEHLRLLFSAYVSNASIKTSAKPVNIRLDILDENKNLLYTATSGDVATSSDGGSWTNMRYLFESAGHKKFILQLVNNNPGGAGNYGNDILLDDISVSIYNEVEVEEPQEAEELWPTAFTPFKADGRNDEFLSPKTPGRQERANWTLLVFDREGRTVYEGKCGWDGKRNGTPVLPGQYYYIVHFPNGGSHKGSVLVVKE